MRAVQYIEARPDAVLGSLSVSLPAAVVLRSRPHLTQPWLAVGVQDEDGVLVHTELDVSGVKDLVTVLTKWLAKAKRGRVGEVGVRTEMGGVLW